LRIDHFDAGGAKAIDFGFAVKDQQLAELQAAFEIATVKKFAGQGTSIVLDKQMIDGVTAAHAANRLTASDADAEGENAVGADVFDLGKLDAVFVAEG
jgi:hypothetical protein